MPTARAIRPGSSPSEWLGSPLAGTYPLHLLANQPADKLHSQWDHGSLSRSNKIKERARLGMSPQDAASRGVANGDVVRVFNARGSILAGAAVDAGVRPGVLQMSTGAWFDPLVPGTIGSLDKHGNPNVLTPDIGTSSLAQGPSPNTCLVQVERFGGELPPITCFHPPELKQASPGCPRPASRDRLTAQGFEVSYLDPDQMAELMKRDIARWQTSEYGPHVPHTRTANWNPTMSHPATTALPLAGVRVIEFCYGRRGSLLRHAARRHGRRRASRSSRPAGDALRAWPPINDGYSENFASLNRNKRSVALDLKLRRARRARAAPVRRGRRRDREQPAGRDGPARPRLRATVRRDNPKLVYCSISAFGQNGPRAERGRLRPDHPGDGRRHERHRRSRRRAGEVRRAALGLRARASTPPSPSPRAAAARAARRHRRRTSTSRCSARTLAIAALQTSEYFGTGRDPAQARLGASAQRAVPGVPRRRTATSPWPPATTACGKRSCEAVGNEPSSPRTRAS